MNLKALILGGAPVKLRGAQKSHCRKTEKRNGVDDIVFYPILRFGRDGS